MSPPTRNSSLQATPTSNTNGTGTNGKQEILDLTSPTNTPTASAATHQSWVWTYFESKNDKVQCTVPGGNGEPCGKLLTRKHLCQKNPSIPNGGKLDVFYPFGMERMRSWLHPAQICAIQQNQLIQLLKPAHPAPIPSSSSSNTQLIQLQ